MDPEPVSEGEAAEPSVVDARTDADQHADDISALHRVTTLTPGDPDQRLGELLEAGCDVLGLPQGFVLLRTDGQLRVRVAHDGPGDLPDSGEVVHDARLDEALAQQATVANLGLMGASVPANSLGSGALVASPLWVTGRVAGAVAFVAPDGREPFTSWQLAMVDLVADGASRILEHEADIRAMVKLESQAQSIIDLIPDPVVRLRVDGQRLAEGGNRVLGYFDPTVELRGEGAVPDPQIVARVQASVVAAVETGTLKSDVYAAGPGPAARRVEARFVPGDDHVVLCIVRDITDRHRAEQALAEQVAFEALVASISTRLIGCAPLLLDEAIEVGLGEIASFFGADGAFIDELAPDGATMRISHLWTHRRATPTRARGARVEISGFGWLTARFERAGHVFVRGPAGIPREAVEEGMVHPDDRGALWVRLGYGGELVGVLGLTWRSNEPPPSDEVLALVRFAADAFLGAIRRRGVALLADGQAEVFELIARGAPLTTALVAAGALLERHTLGATVVIATVDDDGRLTLVADPDDDAHAGWFAALEPGLDNPFGQAVITGEPVMVADALGDPRYRDGVLPDPAFKSATILAVSSPRNGQTLAVVGLMGTEPGAPLARPSVRDSVLALVTVAVERSLDERRLAHQATHDPLTGVGNRAALLDRLTLALARARRSGRQVAALFCDLDSFKAVNDQYGHDRGDRLLVEVAERIGHAVRPSDTVCRTGGDEFVIVCEDLADADQAHTIAERVRTSIEEIPIDIGERRLPVSVSVGVALADLQVDDPDRLLRTADLAMYARKQQRRAERGAGVHVVGTPAIEAPVDGEASRPSSGHDDVRVDPFASDLGDALTTDALRLVYQPLVGRDGAVVGVEALLRWDHPVLGPVSPERVLSVASNDDLIVPLGQWIRRRALRDRDRWATPGSGHPSAPVHLNLAGCELDVPDLATAIVADLTAADADTGDVVLEVRERHLTDSARWAALKRLTSAGLGVLVENAGQGGVSLADLAELPVRGVKLSPSLVAMIHDSGDPGVEVGRALVLLAHGLGWQSHAIGVETDHQRSVLFGFGVRAIQGSLVTMPLEMDELLAWMKNPGRSSS